MNVVIIGAKERCTDADRSLVEALMEGAVAYYPECTFVSMLCNVGVGKFVKDYSLKKDDRENFCFQLIEFRVQIYSGRLTKQEMSALYLARNATMFELGDIFYYFAGPERRGPIEDLINNRVIPAGRPYKVFQPGEDIDLIRFDQPNES